MSVENLSDESVLRLYENIRVEAAVDLAAGGRYHVLGDTAKQRADILRAHPFVLPVKHPKELAAIAPLGVEERRDLARHSVRREGRLGIADLDRAGVLGAHAPLGAVGMMAAPVGHLPAGVVVDPAKVDVAPRGGIRGGGGGPEPAVIVEAVRDGLRVLRVILGEPGGRVRRIRRPRPAMLPPGANSLALELFPNDPNSMLTLRSPAWATRAVDRLTWCACAEPTRPSPIAAASSRPRKLTNLLRWL